MTTHARPTPLPCETGKTAGGGLLATPGALFRRLRSSSADSAAAQPARSLFPDQQWLVTYRRPNGVTATEAVLINGGNLQIDLETLARLALQNQRDTDCATILHIQMDLRAPSARAETSNQITTHPHRARFEAECG